MKRVHREVRTGDFRIREIHYPPGFRQGFHSHEETGVTLVIAGGLRERALGFDEIAAPLSVVVKPAGLMHADEVGPRGAATLQIQLEPSADGAFENGPEALGSWRWLHAGAEARELLALLKILHRPSGTDVGTLEDGVFDLLAQLGDSPKPGSREAEAPRWLRRVRDALEDQIADAPRVRDLAAEAAVHPVSLTRAFRRHYGVTVSRYRARMRLRRAADAIQNTHREISRIAHDAGYADHAHLCRELKAAMGVSPSQLRGLAADRTGARKMAEEDHDALS